MVCVCLSKSLSMDSMLLSKRRVCALYLQQIEKGTLSRDGNCLKVGQINDDLCEGKVEDESNCYHKQSSDYFVARPADSLGPVSLT